MKNKAEILQTILLIAAFICVFFFFTNSEAKTTNGTDKISVTKYLSEQYPNLTIKEIGETAPVIDKDGYYDLYINITAENEDNRTVYFHCIKNKHYGGEWTVESMDDDYDPSIIAGKALNKTKDIKYQPSEKEDIENYISDKLPWVNLDYCEISQTPSLIKDRSGKPLYIWNVKHDVSYLTDNGKDVDTFGFIIIETPKAENKNKPDFSNSYYSYSFELMKDDGLFHKYIKNEDGTTEGGYVSAKFEINRKNTEDVEKIFFNTNVYKECKTEDIPEGYNNTFIKEIKDSTIKNAWKGKTITGYMLYAFLVEKNKKLYLYIFWNKG